MFVGEDAEHRREQLSNVELMMAGYEMALDVHGIEEPGRALSSGFMSYLRETRGWSASCGFLGAIREHSGNADEAWNMFWDLLDEYRRARHPDRAPT